VLERVKSDVGEAGDRSARRPHADDATFLVRTAVDVVGVDDG
jgi:hypothetical protein